LQRNEIEAAYNAVKRDLEVDRCPALYTEGGGGSEAAFLQDQGRDVAARPRRRSTTRRRPTTPPSLTRSTPSSGANSDKYDNWTPDSTTVFDKTSIKALLKENLISAKIVAKRTKQIIDYRSSNPPPGWSGSNDVSNVMTSSCPARRRRGVPTPEFVEAKKLGANTCCACIKQASGFAIEELPIETLPQNDAGSPPPPPFSEPGPNTKVPKQLNSHARCLKVKKEHKLNGHKVKEYYIDHDCIRCLCVPECTEFVDQCYEGPIQDFRIGARIALKGGASNFGRYCGISAGRIDKEEEVSVLQEEPADLGEKPPAMEPAVPLKKSITDANKAAKTTDFTQAGWGHGGHAARRRHRHHRHHKHRDSRRRRRRRRRHRHHRHHRHHGQSSRERGDKVHQQRKQAKEKAKEQKKKQKVEGKAKKQQQKERKKKAQERTKKQKTEVKAKQKLAKEKARERGDKQKSERKAKKAEAKQKKKRTKERAKKEKKEPNPN